MHWQSSLQIGHRETFRATSDRHLFGRWCPLGLAAWHDVTWNWLRKSLVTWTPNGVQNGIWLFGHPKKIDLKHRSSGGIWMSREPWKSDDWFTNAYDKSGVMCRICFELVNNKFLIYVGHLLARHLWSLLPGPMVEPRYVPSGTEHDCKELQLQNRYAYRLLSLLGSSKKFNNSPLWSFAWWAWNKSGPFNQLWDSMRMMEHPSKSSSHLFFKNGNHACQGYPSCIKLPSWKTPQPSASVLAFQESEPPPAEPCYWLVQSDSHSWSFIIPIIVTSTLPRINSVLSI